MKISYFFMLTLLTSTSNIAVATEKDEHREHSAHVHGHAQLSVVVEKNELLVMLETPAMNVFGFEHKPENDEQHKIVHSAVKDLENFEPLLTIDANAECRLVKTDVKQPFDRADAEDHKDEHKHKEDHKEDHKDEHEHDEDHDKEHAESHEESAHTDVDIEAFYKCKDTSKLTKMDLTPLFKRFSLFEELDAQGIINGQQSAAELTKEQPVLSLK